MGVTLFFVLSGYLMSDLLFIKRVSLKDFFVRRFNRVMPLCWLFVACMAIYAKYWQEPKYDVSAFELISTLTFFRTYFPIHTSIWAEDWSIGHLWSLNVEEHNYAFLALGAFVFARVNSNRRSGVCFLGFATLLVLAFNIAYIFFPPAGASPWLLRSECASLGLIAAGFFLMFRRTLAPAWSESISSLVPILTIVLALACFKTYGHKELSRVVGSLALAFSIAWLDRSPGWLRALLSIPILGWFGRCSFSLYLWQEPFYLLLQNKKLSASSAALLALVFGTLSFYIFENPSRKWLNERWSRRTLAAIGGPKLLPAHEPPVSLMSAAPPNRTVPGLDDLSHTVEK